MTWRHTSVHFFAAILLSCVPLVAFAAAPRTFGDVAALGLALIGQATLVLMVTAVAIYFGHAAMSIVHSNKGEAAKQRSTLLWGIIIIFVMVSLWGIIQILQNTLFGNAGGGAIPQSNGGCANFGDPGCGGE